MRRGSTVRSISKKRGFICQFLQLLYLNFMAATHPLFTIIVFVIITGFTIFLFYRAADNSSSTLIITSSWLLLQAILTLSGFYLTTDSISPRVLLFAVPPLLLVITLFATKKGRNFIDQLDPGTLILIHTVRIPVEIVLYWLYLEKQVPKLMTFAGGNYDILSGLTAPLVFYFGFIKKVLSRNIILCWNIICLVLLLLIAGHAVLSIPSPFQKFALDQPNIAVLHFPYCWLPSFIVPIVLFSHLAMIWYPSKKK